MTYSLDPRAGHWGITTCYHCGALRDTHYSDGRCYTVAELLERLAWARRHGRWPTPDEGLEEEH